MDTVLSPVPAVVMLATDGTLVSIPTLQYQRLVAGGVKTITLTIDVAPAVVVPADDWITTKEAALKLMDVVDGLSEKAAMVRIGRDAAKRKFKATGNGRGKRKIDPGTLSLYLDKLRDKERERDRDEESDEMILGKRRELGLDQLPMRRRR